MSAEESPQLKAIEKRGWAVSAFVITIANAAAMRSLLSRIVADGSAPTAPLSKHEAHALDLINIPASFAAFEPVEIIYNGPESYLIKTARHVQHRTGLFILRPSQVMPGSTKNLNYDPIAPRLKGRFRTPPPCKGSHMARC